jgi:hypothetical protein
MSEPPAELPIRDGQARGRPTKASPLPDGIEWAARP